MLTDERATTQGIRDALTGWLIKDAQPGDRLLFQYCGHGSQMPVRTAAGAVTGLHDVICPVDFDFTPAHALSDDDFRQIFAKIPRGVEFNWVSDSCHSGDLARALGITPGRPRYVMPPPDVRWGIESARSSSLQPAGLAKSIEHLNGAFISGCRSDQTSADAVFDGRPNGALSYYLLEVLGQKDGLSTPLTSVVQRVNTELRDSGYSQEPQLHGTKPIMRKPFLTELRGRAFKRAIRRGTLVLNLTMNMDSQQTVRDLIAAVQQQIADGIWEANNNVHGRGCDVSITGEAGSGAVSVSGMLSCHF
jgi:hypothetical protein